MRKLNIKKIKEDLLLTNFLDDILCFVVYGSAVNNQSYIRKSNDVDLCLVMKSRNVTLKRFQIFFIKLINLGILVRIIIMKDSLEIKQLTE